MCVTKGQDNGDGNIAWAVGWGTLTSGKLPEVLQEISFPITTNATCTEYYGTSYKPANQICAGIKGDGKDTCQGDSGGPLMHKPADRDWQLIGLTSWVSSKIEFHTLFSCFYLSRVTDVVILVFIPVCQHYEVGWYQRWVTSYKLIPKFIRINSNNISMQSSLKISINRCKKRDVTSILVSLNLALFDSLFQ